MLVGWRIAPDRLRERSGTGAQIQPCAPLAHPALTSRPRVAPPPVHSGAVRCRDAALGRGGSKPEGPPEVPGVTGPRPRFSSRTLRRRPGRAVNHVSPHDPNRYQCVVCRPRMRRTVGTRGVRFGVTPRSPERCANSPFTHHTSGGASTGPTRVPPPLRAEAACVPARAGARRPRPQPG